MEPGNTQCQHVSRLSIIDHTGNLRSNSDPFLVLPQLEPVDDALVLHFLHSLQEFLQSIMVSLCGVALVAVVDELFLGRRLSLQVRDETERSPAGGVVSNGSPDDRRGEYERLQRVSLVHAGPSLVHVHDDWQKKLNVFNKGVLSAFFQALKTVLVPCSIHHLITDACAVLVRKEWI